jgi:predicted glycogen debranching enzyme
LAKKYGAMANQTRQSFNMKFWNPKDGCLFDVIDDKTKTLPFVPTKYLRFPSTTPCLTKKKARKVVDTVNRELVTPYGLRTLSLGDPKFVGKCSGDSRSRDMAYHNGTIWPWLLGPYVTAYLKVNDYSPQGAKANA